MKCYRCGKEVSDEALHCKYCGALLRITHKLLTAIQAGSKEAIIQLYKMLYNNVYNRFLQLGIDEQEITGLINKAYKDFLLHSHEVTTIEAFEPYFYGICDNIAFSYLKEHNRQPQELDKETFVKPDQSTIDEMLSKIDEKDEKNPKQERKKSHKGIIISVIVIALILAGAGGYYGFTTMNKKAVKKRRMQSYLNINKQYVAAVHAIATNHGHQSYKKITKKYPLVSKQAYVTYYRNTTENIMKNLLYQLYDLDGDGNQELLVGYKDSADMKIIGIYKNNGKKTTSLSPIKDIKHGWNYILTSHRRILKGYKKEDETYVYKLLGFKNRKLVTLQSSIDNPEVYMKKNDLSRITIHGKTIKNKDANDQQILTMQDRWLQYVKQKKIEKANQLGQRMSNNIEDPCAYSMSKDMKRAYLAKIKEYQEKYNGINYYVYDSYSIQAQTMGYLLSDLDGDGHAELMIEWGISNSVNDYLAVFSYENGQIKAINECVQISSSTSLLYYPNHAGIISDYGHTGSQVIQIIYVKNDQIKYKEIADIEFSPEDFEKMYYITSGMELDRHTKDKTYDTNPKLNFDILE